MIRQQDGERPCSFGSSYLPETRATTGDYQHEMTEEDHRELAAVIKQCRGKVMLSAIQTDCIDGELARSRAPGFPDRRRSLGRRNKTNDDGVAMDECEADPSRERSSARAFVALWGRRWMSSLNAMELTL